MEDTPETAASLSRQRAMLDRMLDLLCRTGAPEVACDSLRSRPFPGLLPT